MGSALKKKKNCYNNYNYYYYYYAAVYSTFHRMNKIINYPALNNENLSG